MNHESGIKVNREITKRTLQGSFMVLGLVFIDQLSKWVVFHFDWNLGNWILGVGAFRNYNFAFGLQVPAALMYGIYFIITVLIIEYLYSKKMRGSEVLGWMLIIVGAGSNIVERISIGYVRDFIYIFAGVFNLPDLYILIGLYILFTNKFDTKL